MEPFESLEVGRGMAVSAGMLVGAMVSVKNVLPGRNALGRASAHERGKIASGASWEKQMMRQLIPHGLADLEQDH